MRQDMFHVIVERPRRGGYGGTKGRRLTEINQAIRKVAFDPDRYDEPSNWGKIRPVGRGADRKSLNENLSPLWRFLDARVGRPWSEVYSEIREHLSPDNAVQMHVVQHLNQHVVVDTFLGEDGKVYEHAEYFRYRGGPRCLSDVEDFYSSHYVHPETHLLCATKAKSRHPKKAPSTKFQLSPLRQFRLIDGEWYSVEFEVIDKKLGIPVSSFGWASSVDKSYDLSPMDIQARSYEAIGDILFPDGMPDYKRVKEYGHNNIRAVSKRPIGKRENRQLKTLLYRERKNSV